MAGPRKSTISRTTTPNGIHSEEMNDPYSSSFDPTSFKVVELRKLLHEHQVAFPSTARKADLIKAYEEEIRPRLDELKASRNRDLNIRPKIEEATLSRSNGNGHAQTSSESEKDVESSGNESESQLPPSAMSHPGTPRRGQRSVSWAGDVSGPEDEEEEPDAEADASTFSVHNPFQSSPRLTPEAKSSQKKKAARKSEPAPKRPSTAKKPRSSVAPTMREDVDPIINSSTPLRKIGKQIGKTKSRLSGLGHVKQEAEGNDSGMEADLSRDAYDDPPPSPTSQKRKRSKQQSSKLSNWEVDDREDDKMQTARSLVWFMLVALAMSWWMWYAAESRAVGFCDVGRQSNNLLDERAKNQAIAKQAIHEEGFEKANATLGVPDVLRPSCVACPPHALCQAGILLGCESKDYALQSSVLTHLPLINSLAPLSATAPVCRPDEEKLLLATELAEEIENRLRIWKGNVQCKRETPQFGSLKDISDVAYSLPKDQLHEQLEEELSKGNALINHPSEYFEELWDMAMEDLHATNRIQEEYRGQSIIYTKRGATGVGLECSARLAAEGVWKRIRLWLAMFLALASTMMWFRHRLQSGRIQKDQTKQLVASVLTRLEQVKRYSMQSNKDEEGYLSIHQLRDDVLRHEPLEATKKRLWSAVSVLVEANANVRKRQAKVKGQWSNVWEWIGALEGNSVVKVKPRVKEVEDEVVNMGKERLRNADI